MSLIWTLSTLRDLRNLSSWVPILKRVHSQRSSSPVAPWKFNIYGSFLKWGYPQITKVMDNNFSIESTMVTTLSPARRFQITGEARFGVSYSRIQNFVDEVQKTITWGVHRRYRKSTPFGNGFDFFHFKLEAPLLISDCWSVSRNHQPPRLPGGGQCGIKVDKTYLCVYAFFSLLFIHFCWVRNLFLIYRPPKNVLLKSWINHLCPFQSLKKMKSSRYFLI
jgi:hypothetical protein